MNRTLLLILCDFLLLNLLALTRWEQAEPTRPSQRPAAMGGEGEGVATPEQDVVDVMRLSLEDERASREQLEQQLGMTHEELAERERQLQAREEALAQIESERSELQTDLGRTRESAEEARRRLEQAARDAAASRERLAQLQRDLEQREAEAARQREQLSALEQQQAQARERIERLDVAVQVAEQEKSILRETADTFRQQAEKEREERMRVQETTSHLAQGVGQLAEKSAAITQEMRENRPINANTLFDRFLRNRLPSRIRAERSGFFGPVQREEASRTVLVTDGLQTYALVHLDETPFSIVDPTTDWARIEATLGVGGAAVQVPELLFLAVDPRIVAMPIEPEQAQALGVEVYRTALDPFKFPEAVLISNGGEGYGEVPFKLDPTNPSFVRMDNRLVRRLLGDFSPSRGDLVLSKTGELLGIMVTENTCALIAHFTPYRTLPTGDLGSTRTSSVFGAIAARLGINRVSPPSRR